MRIKIRDWDKHFEADRSRQWKSLKWVPIPNKQGLGYKKIMSEKKGAEIFGCWNAIVQQGSLCTPRGDLTKYSIEDLSIKTIIPLNILKKAINFIIQHLDWIEVIENLDINVNDNDKNMIEPAVGSSMLCNSLLSSNNLEIKDPLWLEDTDKGFKEKNIIPPVFEMVSKYCQERKNGIDAQSFLDHYESNGWMVGRTKMKDWQAAVRTWEKSEINRRQKSGTELLREKEARGEL